MTMKRSEAAALLGKIAIYSGRTVAESDAAAWAEALDPDLTLPDALDAVSAHYRETDVWIMPSHVNARVLRIHRERVARAGTPPMPGDLTYDQEQAWRRLWHAAIRAGEPDAEQQASAAMGLTPPEVVARPLLQAIEAQSRRWSA